MEETKSTKAMDRWSYSRASCYSNCPYEFYLQYIVSDDDLYLSEGNYYAEVGSFVHEILAMIFSGQLDRDDALEYFMDHYHENVFYQTTESIMSGTYRKICDYLSDIDFDWMRDYEVVGVEQEVNFELCGHRFVGFIDLLLRDKNDGSFAVLDHKSSAYPLKANGTVKNASAASFDKYKKQMYLYCYAVKEKYGKLPKRIIWNHFKDGGKLAIIPFSDKEYEDTMNWFKDTITSAECEERFEPNMDYFYCNNLCNFRHSCEYINFSNERK